MNGIKIASANTITSLGFSNEEAASRLVNLETGLKTCNDKNLTPTPVPLSLVDTDRLEAMFEVLLKEKGKGGEPGDYTRLEKLFIISIQLAAGNLFPLLKSRDTILVISTTKGNINLLEEQYRGIFNPDRLFLWKMAEVVKGFFGFENRPVVISNACISGVLAISHAARLLASGKYRHAIVTGGDILSEFVISGFISFQALSPEPCRPFDISRNGLSLGEGVGTMVLTTDPPIPLQPCIEVAGSAMTNDANHISGPSRTGEELALAIGISLKEAGLQPGDIQFISAHGTATAYNDEMESKAVELAGLSDVPLNSFKGFIGHTLGGAGVIESAFSVHSIMNDILFPTAGFSEPGVPARVNVIRVPEKKNMVNVLKTASGFGGCNAAMVFHKINSGS